MRKIKKTHEYHTKYYEENQGKIKKQQKLNINLNKENKKEYDREYNIKNKDLIKEKKRIRYLKDKEKLQEHNQ